MFSYISISNLVAVVDDDEEPARGPNRLKLEEETTHAIVRWTQVDGVTLHDGTPRYAQVEPRHDRHRHVDVRFERFGPIIPPMLRVRRGEDGGPRVEVGLDARLRNRYSLLFHRFVNRDLVRRVHLVELVNTTSASVSQYYRPCF